MPIPVLDGGHLVFYAYEAGETCCGQGSGGGMRSVCFAGVFDVVRDLERPAKAQPVRPRRARFVSRRQPPMVPSMMMTHRASVSLAGRWRAPLFSVATLVLAAGLAGTAAAQTAPAPGAEPVAPAAAAPVNRVAGSEAGVVNRILVRGNQRIDQTTVLSYLPIQPGDTVDGALLDVALRTLTRTRCLRTSSWAFSPNGDLIITIVENPIINQVVFGEPAPSASS